MSAQDVGSEPAYPLPKDWLGYGLTKREEFAKAVIQGFAADPNTATASPEALAAAATRMADALLAELAKPVAQAGPHPSLTYDQAREVIAKAGEPYIGYTDRAVTAIDVAERLGIPAGRALVEAAAAILPKMRGGLRIQRSSDNRQPWHLSRLADLERATESVRRIAEGEALPE